MLLRSSITAIALSLAGNVLVAGAGDLFIRGNSNGDAAVDISDAVFIFNFLYLGNEAPNCLDAADTNDDGRPDISDGIFLLNHLFLGGARPPEPSPGAPCPGPDPTPDKLDCRSGLGSPAEKPSLEAYPVIANAPGVRQRSRSRLPIVSGTATYAVAEGTSFVVLLVATSNRVTRAGFALQDPADPLRGNPALLRLTADRPLGDPESGGAAAGENLAVRFYAGVEGWHDPIYLLEHAGLRVSHDGPLAPAPGLYRFTAAVTDVRCAESPEASFTLEVLPSRAPELFAWIEHAASPQGAPEPHHAGSGNARVAEEGFLLVAEALPNGRALVNGAPPPDPDTFRIAADPAVGDGADLSTTFVRDPGAPARFSLRLDPAVLFPAPGNTRFAVEIATAPGENVRSIPFTLERAVSYPNRIQPIWNEHCTGCHEEPGPEKGLELVAPGEDPRLLRRNIVNVYASEPAITSTAPLLVWPYFPEQSYLYHKLRGTHLDPQVAGEGDRMPQNAANYLPDATLHLIQSWILQGAEP